VGRYAYVSQYTRRRPTLHSPCNSWAQVVPSSQPTARCGGRQALGEVCRTARNIRLEWSRPMAGAGKPAHLRQTSTEVRGGEGGGSVKCPVNRAQDGDARTEVCTQALSAGGTVIGTQASGRRRRPARRRRRNRRWVRRPAARGKRPPAGKQAPRVFRFQGRCRRNASGS